MNTTKHTPGPWAVGPITWNFTGGYHTCKITAGEAPNPASQFSRPVTVGYFHPCDTDHRPFDQDIQHELPMEANAARIVACVNNCEGINPEAVPEMLKLLKQIQAHVLEDVPMEPKRIASALYTVLAKAEVK